jgi:hypothetical protein
VKRLQVQTSKLQSIVPYDYKGYQCISLIEWDNREITNELLKIIVTDNPDTRSIYACEIFLLDKPGWKQLKNLAIQEKICKCMVNQANIWIRGPKDI